MFTLVLQGPAKPVPFQKIAVRDRFWTPRMETNRRVTVPHRFAELEKAGNLENFRLAIAGARKGYHGPVYMDSDVYKVLEGASMTLDMGPDAKVERLVADRGRDHCGSEAG